MSVQIVEVPTLFDAVDVIVEFRAQKVEEAFRTFCRRNPDFMRRVACVAYDHRCSGRNPLSMNDIFGALRSDFHPNKSWTKLATLRLIGLYPDFDGAFRMRGKP